MVDYDDDALGPYLGKDYNYVQLTHQVRFIIEANLTLTAT